MDTEREKEELGALVEALDSYPSYRDLAFSLAQHWPQLKAGIRAQQQRISELEQAIHDYCYDDEKQVGADHLMNALGLFEHRRAKWQQRKEHIERLEAVREAVEEGSGALKRLRRDIPQSNPLGRAIDRILVALDTGSEAPRGQEGESDA